MGKDQNRDSKGRFVKGHNIGREYLDPATKENAAERGRLGGQACAAKMREQKMLKEVLRDILLEKVDMVASNGQRVTLTKQEVIVQNVLNRMQKKGTPKDLKIIAEILGEMEINVNLNQAEKPTIVFDDGEDE